MIAQALNSILTLAFPQSCEICGRSVEDYASGNVCEICWSETRLFCGDEVLCDKCGAFLAENNTGYQISCRRCGDDEFDQAMACGIYEKALLFSILRLKHQQFLPGRIEELLIARFRSSPFQDAGIVVPVPLSKEKFAERGFNQASIIAGFIAKKTALKFDGLSLARKIHSERHRAGMDKKARANSVKNAFEVTRPKLIEGQNILLADDVFASGATVSNCAKALKKAGAKKVYVLSIARAA